MTDIRNSQMFCQDGSFFEGILRYRSATTPHEVPIYDWGSRTGYSWIQLEQRAASLSSALYYDLGLRKGDRIGFIASTTVALFDALFACGKGGFVITTYNGRLIPQEIIRMVENETPRVVFYTKDFSGKVDYLREHLSYECSFVCVDASCDGEKNHYEDLIDKNHPPVPHVDIRPEDPLMLIHTGGTTGYPKSAIHSHGNVFLSAVNVTIAWKVTRADVAYICMPFFHVGGWNCPALGMLMVGARMIIAPNFEPGVFFDVTQECRPSFFFATESMLRTITRHERFEAADLSCYRWFMNGGSPITNASMEPFWDRGIRVFNGFGMTELVAYVLSADTSTSLEENRRKGNTVGKPLPFSCIEIRNANDEAAVPYEIGELCVKCSGIFSGYWKDPDATAAAIRDGWFYTGDLGYYDVEGDFYVCGRSKDMFISGGENIFPLEIESALSSHPAVLECAVVGVPDSKWGEVGVAFVVAEEDSGLTSSEIKRYLDECLSTIKQPKEYYFVDSIPKTSVGKKDLAALDMLARQRVENVCG